jgi:hypothetical protein
MTVSLKLTIPNRIAFNGALVRVNSMRPIILNEDNHTDLTIDEGKNCY